MQSQETVNFRERLAQLRQVLQLLDGCIERGQLKRKTEKQAA